MRRRVPWWLLAVAFVLVPLVEIYVIVQVGQVIGAWWTIALLVADSLVGAWLVKREGVRAWRSLRSALNDGRMPATELADGALILAGGALMLTPGFVTDVLGGLCVLPFTRPLGRKALGRLIGRRLVVSRGPAGFSARGGAAGQTRGRPEPDVVRGDVVD